ncbi:MAG: hypothetical protein AAF570_22525, partial [Bacteroidota bacterium]
MKFPLNGQLSNSYAFAQNFVSKLNNAFITSLFIAFFLFLSPSLNANTILHPVPQAEQTTYSWSLNVSLNCQIGGSGMATTHLYASNPDFEGFSAVTILENGGETLTFKLSGPVSELPSYAEVATISITEPGCAPVTYLITTDGGG